MNENISDYKIYVACLASYNTGRLHGDWISISGSMADDDLLSEIEEKVLSTSKVPDAEEWAIHDYDLGGIRISEFEDLSNVVEIVKTLEDHNNDDLVSKVYDHYSDIEETNTALSENYIGTFDNLSDWAENYIEQCGSLEPLDDRLKMYFDYQAYARDAELGGDILPINTDNGVAVFYLQ